MKNNLPRIIKDWKKPFNVVIPLALMFLIVAIAIAVVIFLSTDPVVKKDDLISNIVAIASILVAALALSCSYVTYNTIDSVNIKSKMEGNVLENSHYIKNLIGLIKDNEGGDYGQITSDETAREQFLKKLKELEDKRKDTTSGTVLADELQYSIDFIPLLAFLMVNQNRYNNDEERGQKEVNVQAFRKDYVTYLKELDIALQTLEKDSNGSIRVLKEAKSLIDATAKYQYAQNKKFKNNEEANKELDKDKKNAFSDIMKIDSSLLRNLSCKCLYYKYLGLCYMKSSLRVLSEDGTETIENFDNLKIMRDNYRSKNGDEQQFICDNLREAKTCFLKVVELAGQDLFWRTIYFDLARVEFYQTWFNDEDDTQWKNSMKNAMESRFRLVRHLNQALCDEDNVIYNKNIPFDDNTTYFRAAMIEQYHQSVLCDIKFRMLCGKNEDNERMIANDFARLPESKLPEKSRTFDKEFQDLKTKYYTNVHLTQYN